MQFSKELNLWLFIIILSYTHFKPFRYTNCIPKFVAHTRFNGNHFLSLSYDEFDLSEFLIVFILVFLKMMFFLSFRPITYEGHIHKSWNMMCACSANFPSIIWDMCKINHTLWKTFHKYVEHRQICALSFSRVCMSSPYATWHLCQTSCLCSWVMLSL
jgi:hypothetical protein